MKIFLLMKSVKNYEIHFQELVFIMNVLITVLTTSNLKQYSKPKSYIWLLILLSTCEEMDSPLAVLKYDC